jgi:hypothetical protein
VTQNAPPSANITCDNTPWEKGGLKLASLLGCSETHYPGGKINFVTKTVIKIRAATGLIKVVGTTGLAFEGVIPPATARADGKPVEIGFELIGTEIEDAEHPENNTFTVESGDLRFNVRATLAPSKQIGGTLSFADRSLFAVKNQSALNIPYGRGADVIESGTLNLSTYQRSELHDAQFKVDSCDDGISTDIASSGSPVRVDLFLETGESRLAGGTFRPSKPLFAKADYRVRCASLAAQLDAPKLTAQVTFAPSSATVTLSDVTLSGRALSLSEKHRIPILSTGKLLAGNIVTTLDWSPDSATLKDFKIADLRIADSMPEKKIVDDVRALSSDEEDLFTILDFPSPKKQQLASINTNLAVLAQMATPNNSPNVVLNIPKDEIQSRIQQVLSSVGLQKFVDTAFGRQEFSILAKLDQIFPAAFGTGVTQIVLHLSPAIKDNVAIIRPSISLVRLRGVARKPSTPLQAIRSQIESALNRIAESGDPSGVAITIPIPPIVSQVDLAKEIKAQTDQADESTADIVETQTQSTVKITDKATKSVIQITAQKFDTKINISPVVFLIDPDGLHILGRIAFQ